MTKSEQMSKALDAVAKHLTALVKLSEKCEDQRLFTACLGTMNTHEGIASWQLYQSILRVIDVLGITYMTSSHSSDAYCVSIRWAVKDGYVTFFELVDKEEYYAWQSQRIK